MKKTLIIIGAIVGLFLLLLTLASIFGPSIAKKYIEKHSKELVGRQVWISKLHLNLFTGSVGVDGFRMMEKNDNDIFVSFDTLEVNVKIRNLLAKELYIRNISVVSPKIVILQKGSNFNFSDLLNRPKDTTNADTSKSSFSFKINNIVLRHGGVYYKDKLLNSSWDMTNLSLKIPSLYFSGEKTDVGLEFAFASGGYFKSRSDYNIETGRYNLNIDLKDLDCAGALPYIQQYAKVNSFAGLLSAKLAINGDVNHVLDLMIKGSATAKKVSLSDQGNAKVADIGNVSLTFRDINFKENRFLFDSFRINGATLNFEMLKTGNNLSQLVKPASSTNKNTPSTKRDERPIRFEIKEVALSGINLNFSDKTLRRHFIYPITNISISSNNVGLNGINNVRLNASLPGGGKTSLEWNGHLNSMANQNLSVDVKNLSLKYFSPYVEQYTAYPLTKGVLSLSSINHVKSFMLDAKNKFEAFKVEAGKKDKGLKPEVKVPLRTALYIVKDKDDKIKFDVPVKGLINSPEFSYRKIVFKTIINLLVKVAVAPVNFIGKQLGLTSDIPKEISFDLVQTDLNTQQNAVLGDLAAIVNSKPELVLSFTQQVDTQAVMQQIAFAKTRIAYYRKMNNIKDTSFTIEQKEAIAKIGIKDPMLGNFIDSLTQISSGTMAEKMLTLYSRQELGYAAEKIFNTQFRSIIGYLTTVQNVPARNIKVITSKDVGKGGKESKNTLYLISLGLEGEDSIEN